MIDKPRVLIVDDAPEIIQVLIITLKDEFTILAANSGEKALEMAAAKPQPDIILLDIVMPGMNGLEVCRKLKGNEKTSRIPVLFLTAQGDELDELKGLDCGALDYIPKPFNPVLVRARMHNHLELKKYQDNLALLVLERTHALVATQNATMIGLATLAEYRDPETSAHLSRTKKYVKSLTEHLMDLPEFNIILNIETVELICNTAPLHDIGKVGVPDRILLKPGVLTEDEFNLIKLHTVYGRDTINNMQIELVNQDSDFLRVAAELVYTHHEKWDGTGYHGIKGNDIPIPGRIMALADVYDALTSKRAYKEPMSHRKAVEIITKGDGRTDPNHFDPDVLNAFVLKQDDFLNIALELADSDEVREILQS